MREIVHFLYQKSRNKPIFWAFVFLYTLASWKALNLINRLESNMVFLIGFFVVVGLAPVWGYRIGRNGLIISYELEKFKREIEILENDVSTQRQKDFAAMQILKNPNCDKKAIETILRFTEPNTIVNDLALAKLKELMTLIPKP